MVSTPEPPDPMETASAQAGMNRDTATTQQMLNMVNQVGPDGSLMYNQSGSNSFIGADGKKVNIPQFTATTTLSPQQQAIKTQSDKASLNLAGLAADQSGKLQELLNTPFTYDNKDAENWAYDLASQRLLPQQKQTEDQLRTTLANKGIREGSAAWNSEMSRMTNANTDQLNQLALNGRQQGFTEAQALRTEPINEITALMSGGQVSQPTFGQTPQTGVAGVDYTGLVNQKYQADLKSSQSTMGGLFGLLGTGISMFSDRRLKRDIRRVGTLDNGLPVYAYRYVTGGPIMLGLMADEVSAIAPEAVSIHESGYAMVDYGRAA